MKDKGFIHIYYGYGKGKTTAALGLALRANGYGLKVVIVQFLKVMTTGELISLERLDNIKVFRGAASEKFTNEMTPYEKEETASIHNSNLKEALSLIEAGECDLLILDEVLDAYQLGMLDEELFKSIVIDKPQALELVITGHKETDWVLDKGDYITEMKNIRHPFEKGIGARKGIEY